VCGNGVKQADEECDGEDFGTATCVDFGFDEGTLACTDCVIVPSCTGVESCFDGRDNDGDGDVDCTDSDCFETCLVTCSEALPVLSDPAVVLGSTLGHAALITASCGGGAQSPEVAYAFTAAKSGVLDAKLTSSVALTLSLRTTCEDDLSETACKLLTPTAGRLTVPVTAGESFVVVVDGVDPYASGSYELDIRTRSIVCGDGLRDAPEACDDGNLKNGDGCSSACLLESKETASNDTAASASPYLVPFAASIDPPGDVDFVSFVVSEPAVGLVIETLDFGDDACKLYELDTYLTLYDTNGTTVLAEADDQVGSSCALLEYGALPAGTYFVKIQAYDGESTFPYLLSIRPNYCGNNILSSGEECDDGNLWAGDGCSELCKLESDS
jgi:cysteine-rich repeat protein